MRRLIVSSLVLSLTLLYGPDPLFGTASQRMAPEQMMTAVGAGFWGGLVCGVAVTATAVGVTAMITAAGAGATLPFAAYLGTSAALHVAGICAMLK